MPEILGCIILGGNKYGIKEDNFNSKNSSKENS